MKFIFLTLLFISAEAWSKAESNCEIVNGFYRNSSETLQDVKLETHAEIFTLNNGKTLSLVLNGKVLRFQRNDLSVKKYTRMKFSGGKNHVALLTIDRTPKEALKSKDFYASILLANVKNSSADRSFIGFEHDTLTYNLYCKF